MEKPLTQGNFTLAKIGLPRDRYDRFTSQLEARPRHRRLHSRYRFVPQVWLVSEIEPQRSRRNDEGSEREEEPDAGLP